MYKEYLNCLKSEKISEYRQKEKLTSLINKKTIRYHLDKLIREYNILPEERKPLNVVKHVTKTLFWATVYLAFSYLTITSTFEVIQQYRDDEVTTNMRAIINNNVTYLPNMTICLKINALELFNTSSSSNLHYMSAWSRFFEETISHEGIFKVKKHQIYDDEIYLSLFKYLGMIYEAERAWEPGLTQMTTFHSEEADDWIALRKVLVPNIERYNITLEQLKGIFDGKFCSSPGRCWETDNNLLALYHNENYQRECITGSKISFIGMDTICFRLIGYQIYLQPLSTTESVYLKLYSDCNNRIWYHEITFDLGSESRSTPRRAAMRNEKYSYYYNRFITKAEIGVKALYRKLPYVNGNLQCSSDTNQEECENKCLRGWIRANCHCSPITFNLTADTSSSRDCKVNDYSVCLRKYAENATYLCTNKCVPLCEQWHYQIVVESPSVVKEIGISLRTFDYVIIEQVFTWPSFEEFIGALGGALGIWLGLDFVIIIEFIVKLVTKLIKKILLRSGHNSEEDEHQNSANVKNRVDVKNGISSSNEIGRRVVGHQKEGKENESEIAGTSIRRINESEQQRTPRKKRESNTLKEKHVQQRRTSSNNNRVDSAITDGKMKNIDAHDGRLRNQKVNVTDNVDAVQYETTEHTNSSTDRSWFLQKMLFLPLNSDVPTSKSTVFLRLVEKLFWAIIYLVGSVFTTLWCIELINLHLADEAVYYPLLMINRAVTMPPPSLCIPFRYDRLFSQSYVYTSALVDYFDKSDIDRASFIQVSNGTAWPEPLVSIGLFYFSILAISLTDDSAVSFTAYYGGQLDASTGGDISVGDDIDKSLNYILLPKLLEWNITATELQQKLGAELARMIELKISFTNNNGTTDIVNETSFYTAAITNKLFCFTLSNLVTFSNPDEMLEFSVNHVSYLYQILSYRIFIIFSDYLLEPKSPQPGYLAYDVPIQEPTIFDFSYGGVTNILISVDSLYTSRPVTKGVKYCSPKTTKLYCRAQCRIELIEKLCNCSPTYWTAMIPPTSGLDACTFERYMECLNFNGSDDHDCKDSCLPFCTARYFRSDVHSQFRFGDPSTIAYIRFRVKDGIYVSVEEKPTFTLSDLLIKV